MLKQKPQSSDRFSFVTEEKKNGCMGTPHGPKILQQPVAKVERRYTKGQVPAVDHAMARMHLVVCLGGTSWWNVAKALDLFGLPEALLAEEYAMMGQTNNSMRKPSLESDQ